MLRRHRRCATPLKAFAEEVRKLQAEAPEPALEAPPDDYRNEGRKRDVDGPAPDGGKNPPNPCRGKRRLGQRCINMAGEKKPCKPWLVCAWLNQQAICRWPPHKPIYQCARSFRRSAAQQHATQPKSTLARL